jgi:hypothetical protein
MVGIKNSWFFKLLKVYLANLKFEEDTLCPQGLCMPTSAKQPRSLRAAFRTFLSDHKVDPLYIEYWMGHALPEQQIAYINKSMESWRQTYRQQAEQWLTPPQYKNSIT